ncbi:MAG: hypothetical protein HND39_04815 [Ignavibacteriota bacterium]|nr:hypothetical protein [Ignavibacteriales bacterium]MCC7092784.1 hypothetical protein [Ignavibacteriaceae bacterium]MEB2295924.1 hypothetical protein [Ignavibacteria bacterium]QKJ95654.1 MAG: hypothetical protein HND39_04815 [Ignavibacteriota bacterium]MCL4279410.1 hypothetical protein [Ignavibacteriaceae bacterium]
MTRHTLAEHRPDDTHFQKKRIEKKLIEATKRLPAETKLILLSAPTAVDEHLK